MSPYLKRNKTGTRHTENIISGEGTIRRREKLAESNLVAGKTQLEEKLRTSLNYAKDIEDYQPTAHH